MDFGAHFGSQAGEAFGGAFGVTPLGLPGLDAYWEAESLTTADSGLIASLPDLTGNGITFAAAGANRPAMKRNAFNGRPAIQFAGSQYMAATIASTPKTIFIVGQRDRAATSDQGWLGADVSGGAAIILSTHPNPLFYVTGAGGLKYAGLPGAPDKQLMIFCCIIDGTTLKIYTDGSGVPAATAALGGAQTAPGGSLVLGAYSWDGTVAHKMTGLIAAAGFANRVLTTAEMAQLFGYFEHKYFTANPTGPYIMACMSGVNADGDYALQMLQSADGIAYTAMPVCCLPAVGNLREPSILKVGAKWYLAYTSQTKGEAPKRQFAIATSDTLSGVWRHVCFVDCTAVGTDSIAWAPSLFLDTNGTVYAYIHIASEASVYVLHATAADLSTWSAPTLVMADAYDPYMVKVGSTYYLWYVKSDIGEHTVYASSSSPTGPFVDVVTGDWAGWGIPTGEGPCVFLTSPGHWRCVMDNSGGPNTLSYCDQLTGDWTTGTSTWSAPAPLTSNVAALKNGEVVKL